MPSDCPYCEEPYLNFSGDDEEVEMWIEKTRDGERVIATDSPCEPPSSYAWSIPINYCPFCGRDLMKKVDE